LTSGLPSKRLNLPTNASSALASSTQPIRLLKEYGYYFHIQKLLIKMLISICCFLPQFRHINQLALFHNIYFRQYSFIPEIQLFIIDQSRGCLIS
jgi:hypothetical protein